MKIKEFFDEETFTLTYLVFDENTKDSIIIDPVLNYEPYSSTLSTESLNELLDFIQSNKLNPLYSIETHAHADHITSAQWLKSHFPNIKTAIHENIKMVQEIFNDVFNLKVNENKPFDTLLTDGQVLSVGSLNIKVIHTPGHTPACASLLVNNEALFTGDSLFMPDFGTGRCDFPKGDARQLFKSIKDKIYSLPDKVDIYVGHDYQPNGRDLKFKTTVKESKMLNVHLNENTKEQDFIEFRTSRDKILKAPKLLLPSIQININNGELPKTEANGVSYIKIPIKIKEV